MSDNIIRIENGKLIVPNKPVMPFIEGDGIGPDIWAAAVRVFDAAVEKAYGGERKIQWLEVLAGEKAFNKTGSWLPEETLDAFRKYLVGIKGPLTTPIGGGIRSLNVALRQELDLYVCQRHVRYFRGVDSPVKRPDLVDMVIFRENTEDIYAGIEFERGSDDVEKLKAFLKDNFPKKFAKVRFPNSCGIGIKPVSEEGTARLVRSAINYAIAQNRKSVTLVHKGNIVKFTEARSATGATRSRAKSSARSPSTAARGASSRTGLSSRTALPTRSCSRFSRVPPNTTSSPRSTSTATTSPTRSPRRSAESALPPAETSTTRRDTRFSKPPTAPLPSMRTSTR